MIRFRPSLTALAVTATLVATALPMALAAKPSASRDLPTMIQPAAAGRSSEIRIPLAEADQPAPRHVLGDTAAAAAPKSAFRAAIGEAAEAGPATVPPMPGAYESVLIVLATAGAGALGLWLGHLAGFLRLFRSKERLRRSRA